MSRGSSEAPGLAPVNFCVFSADRTYRYLLVHRWDHACPRKACLWIGLNPSLADERRLDRTLLRIRDFSAAAGFNALYLTNLFALVSTDRKALRRHRDPIGPENDDYLLRAAARVSTIFVAWGAGGKFLERDRKVLRLIRGTRLKCLGISKEGFPRHPLYVAATVKQNSFLSQLDFG